MKIDRLQFLGRTRGVGALRLQRGRPRSPLISLAMRLGLAAALLAVAVAANWLNRDSLRDSAGGPVTLSDVLYFTMITIASVGYGDIVPVTEGARLIDTFLVAPIRLFVWLIFLGTAYEFVLQGIGEKWRMRMIQSSLKDHFVVIGYGTSGTEAVSELIRRGADPKTIVVLDEHEDRLEAAKARGATVMNADATMSTALKAVHIGRAKSVMIASGRDDTSILIVLTVRRVAPDIPISVVIRSKDNEMIARQAGANTVINPASFAGLLMAGSVHGPHTADCLADLASTGGHASLNERAALPEEIGFSLSDIRTGLGMRLYRGHACIGFWEPGANKIEANDIIVEVIAEPTGHPPLFSRGK